MNKEIVEGEYPTIFDRYVQNLKDDGWVITDTFPNDVGERRLLVLAFDAYKRHVLDILNSRIKELEKDSEATSVTGMWIDKILIEELSNLRKVLEK